MVKRGLPHGAEKTFTDTLNQLFPVFPTGAERTSNDLIILKATQYAFLSMVQRLIDYSMELYSPSEETPSRPRGPIGWMIRAESILKEISKKIPPEYTKAYVNLLLENIRGQEGKPNEIMKGKFLRGVLMSLNNNQRISREDVLRVVDELLKNAEKYGDQGKLSKLKTELERTRAARVGGF